MTIFDLQGGEVNEADFGVPATGPRLKSSEDYQPVESEMGGKEEQPEDKAAAMVKKKSGKDKKKGKKEKEKEKEKEKSEHYKTCILNCNKNQFDYLLVKTHISYCI